MGSLWDSVSCFYSPLTFTQGNCTVGRTSPGCVPLGVPLQTNRQKYSSVTILHKLPKRGTTGSCKQRCKQTRGGRCPQVRRQTCKAGLNWTLMFGLSEGQPECMTYIPGVVRIRSIVIVLNCILYLKIADRWASFQFYHYEQKAKL